MASLINDTIAPDVPAGVLQVADTEQDPDSYTPLLSVDKDGDQEQTPPSPISITPHQQKIIRSALFLVILAAILLDIATYASVAPLQRIYESIICRTYYRENDPSFLGSGGWAKEEDCKIKPVQSELAMLRGWQVLCDSIPGILLTIPYGILSDRIGRKPVIILSLVGICVSYLWIILVCWFPDTFSIWLVLYNGLFQILGGGSTVASSVIFVVLADVVSSNQRSTIFFQVQASILLAAVVSYPLSSVLMVYDPWLPIYLCYILFVAGSLGLLFIPETLNWQATAAESHENDNMESTEDPAHETESPQDLRPKLFVQKMMAKVVQELRETGLVFNSLAVSVLTFTMLISSVGRASLDLVMQYASARFQWSFARASNLLTLQAGISFVLLLLVLPIISKLLLSRFSLHANTKDLYITQCSLFCTIIGLFGLGFSFSPPTLIIAIVILSLGSGFIASIRSLTTSLVKPNQVGRLYAVMGVVQMIGPLIAGPTLSKSYGWGLDLGGLWDGLPFHLAAIMHVFVAMPLFMLRLGSPSGEIHLPETA